MKLLPLFLLLCLPLFAGQPPKPSYILSNDGSGTNTTLYSPVVSDTLLGEVNAINLGTLNEIGQFSDFDAIVGGSLNTIAPNTASAFIGGGDANIVSGGACSAVIAGLHNETYGDDNDIILGGSYNTISLNSGWSAVLVGDHCRVDGVPGSDYNVILGGSENVTAPPGRFFMSILGGQNNKVAASEATVIGSGITNTTPGSVEIGLKDSAKLRVARTGVVLVGLPLIVQDTNGLTWTRIYTQNGQIYSEAVR